MGKPEVLEGPGTGYGLSGNLKVTKLFHCNLALAIGWNEEVRDVEVHS